MKEENMPESIEIKLKVSTDTEATASPWWMIIDPRQNMKVNSYGISNIAAMITGPFFSREEAEAHLEARRYAYSKNAGVYCDSGWRSRQYDTAYKTAYAAVRKELSK